MIVGGLWTRLRSVSAADRYRKDPEAARRLLDEAAHKAQGRGVLAGVWQDVTTLIALVRAYFDGRYRQVPWKTVASAIGALAYFVMPIDATPDFIPLVGYVDDALVLSVVFKALRVDMERFRAWQKQTSVKVEETP